MAQVKHRPFNADRFLDKFRGSEAALKAYLGLWDGLIPGLPEPFEVDAFKDFLKTPPDGCRPFEEMVEGLYQGWQASHETLSRLARRSVRCPPLHPQFQAKPVSATEAIPRLYCNDYEMLSLSTVTRA